MIVKKTRLIDADSLERVLKAYYKPDNNKPYGGLSTDAIAAMAAIDDAQTVEAELVRRGKWIADNKYADCYNCSLCNDLELETYKYCPKCGARME